MTEQPNTAAGRALLGDVTLYGPNADEVRRVILAIEAEARQDGSALHRDALAVALHGAQITHGWGCGPDSTGCRQRHRMDADAILALLPLTALPPSAPAPDCDAWMGKNYVCTEPLGHDGVHRSLGKTIAEHEAPPSAPAGLDETVAEIRVMLADLIVTLDTPNPRLALQTGIETIDYWLAHIRHIARLGTGPLPGAER